MAQAEVLKEFLVQLGFKTDEKSLKRFSDGVGEATKSVVKLVASIQAAALTVGAGVAAFASNLEALYFAAQKTGASATNLKAFSGAMRNFGVESGEALGSVQALARFMRNTPGAEGFLKSLGVETRDVNGKLLDTTEIMLNLGKAMKTKQWYQAKQYGDALGISEDTMRALVNGDFERELKKQRERMKDTGFDKASEDAHKFMEGLRELQTYLEAFALKVQEALMKKLGVSMEQFAEWFRKNGPMIADRVADVLIAFLKLAEAIVPAIMWIVDKLMALDKATDGWSTKALAAVAIFQTLGGASLIGGIVKLASAFGGLGASLGTVVSTLPALAAAGAAGWYVGTKIYENMSDDSKNTVGGTIAQILANFGNEEAQHAIDVEMRAKAGLNNAVPTRRKTPAAGSAAAPAAGGANTADPMAFFMSMGWSKEQAAGIVANLKQESGFKHNAVGDSGQAYGIAQWHPDRQRNFAKWAGKDIRQSTLQEQMAFVHYELTQGAEFRAGKLLRASNNARQAGEIVSRHYERPGIDEAARLAEANKRGASAAQIAQTTNININGSGDAKSTAVAVAQEQERVNANMTRNMKSAVS